MNSTIFPIASLSASVRADEASEMAAILARRCSQPCPEGDQVKAAIGRAADRAGLSSTRMRDIWYRDARQIELWEMDALRRGADEAEVDLAVAGIKLARQHLDEHGSDLAREVAAKFDDALRILGRGPDASSRKA